MFFTIWYGVYNKSTRELTYASGGHPPALFFEKATGSDSNATYLRTANKAIGAMPDETYEKSKHLVGEQITLFLFSDIENFIEKPRLRGSVMSNSVKCGSGHNTSAAVVTGGGNGIGKAVCLEFGDVKTWSR